MISFPKLPHELIYFSSIGAVAALTHILVVLNLVTYLHILPLFANVAAFLIAFNVSYFGHKYVTFANVPMQKQLSLPHYFLVASSAGILNELLYFLVLTYTNINYLLGLTIVLALVAGYSFLLSRFWACR